jgi:hypothetical protein
MERLQRDVPRQQFVDPIDRVVGDALQHVGQIGLRVQVVELGRTHEAVNRSRSFSAGIGTGKQVVFAAQGDGAQRPFGGVVVDFDSAVIAEAR